MEVQMFMSENVVSFIEIYIGECCAYYDISARGGVEGEPHITIANAMAVFIF